MFTMGGLSGVMHASPPVDLQQTDTYFVVAHFHYVLFGGSIFGLFSGIYYWWPKITGRLLDERLGLLALLAHVRSGFNLTFFPHALPRAHRDAAADLHLRARPRLELLEPGLDDRGLPDRAVLLVFIANVVKTTRSAGPAGADPWDARTLEWSIPSPPPPWNFSRIPIVRDRDEFWLRKHRGRGGPPVSCRAASCRVPARAHPHATAILLADPRSAGSLLVMVGGLLIGIEPVVIGGMLTLYCIARFALEYHRRPSGYEVLPPLAHEAGVRGKES